ncbi:MAG: glycosyltransferase family 39 protein [Abditibacteriota bacterium]|nr:glycosyltransferase family 39 protein [Abditibacteriota bacterium]
MIKRYRHGICLGAIFILGLLLRLWGIRWGLPCPEHTLSLHPDEFLTVGCAAEVAFTDKIVPGFYNYPSLFIYLGSATLSVMNMLADPTVADWHFAMRLISAIAGSLAVLATYFAAKNIFGCRGMSLFAAAALAVAPLHVQHSHFATVDVFSTLPVALALLFAGKVLHEGGRKNIVLAGIMTGLAAGTRYNACFVIFAVIAAWLMSPERKLRNLLLCFAAAAVAFVVTTPGCLLDSHKFFSDLAYESAHSADGHDLVFAGLNGFVYNFAHSLKYGLGSFLLGMWIVGLIAAALLKEKPAAMLWSFPALYYIALSASRIMFARYMLVLFPAAAVVVGYLSWGVARALKGKGRDMWLIAVVGGMWLTLTYTVGLNNLFCYPSPQMTSAKYIGEHVKKGESVAFFEPLWFYSPALHPEIGGTPDDRTAVTKSLPYDVTILSQNRGALKGVGRPKYVVESDYETADAERLRGKKIRPKDRKKVDAVNGDIADLKKNYRSVKIFMNELDIMGVKLFDARHLPHDMRYAAPRITLYEAKK